jgi:hypothetical protein
MLSIFIIASRLRSAIIFSTSSSMVRPYNPRTVSTSAPLWCPLDSAATSFTINVDGGKMHHAPHSRLLTRSEQNGNAIDVDTARAIFWSILKHASAVYNRIHPIEVRDP